MTGDGPASWLGALVAVAALAMTYSARHAEPREVATASKTQPASDALASNEPGQTKEPGAAAGRPELGGRSPDGVTPGPANTEVVTAYASSAGPGSHGGWSSDYPKAPSAAFARQRGASRQIRFDPGYGGLLLNAYLQDCYNSIGVPVY